MEELFSTYEEIGKSGLFDAEYYLATYSDVAARNIDPLVHYLEEGAREGRNPYPDFDSGFYLEQCRLSGEQPNNPLLHFIRIGAARGFKTQSDNAGGRSSRPIVSAPSSSEGAGDFNPFSAGLGIVAPEQEGRGSGKTEIYQKKKGRSRSRGAAAEPIRSSDATAANDQTYLPAISSIDPCLDVFIAYGPSYVSMLDSVVLPALHRESNLLRLHVHIFNNWGHDLEDTTPRYQSSRNMTITNWSDKRDKVRYGYGEAINFIFKSVNPQKFFLQLNPDIVIFSSSLKRLVQDFRPNDALLEAVQWPYPHPKNVSFVDHTTPWASCACVLTNAEWFNSIQGFDPAFFLYCDDVDLGFQAQIAKKRVRLVPGSVVMHWTGLMSYRPFHYTTEELYSAAGTLLLAQKYFGEAGVKRAKWHLFSEGGISPNLRLDVLKLFDERKVLLRKINEEIPPDKCMILGYNRYHYLDMDLERRSHLANHQEYFDAADPADPVIGGDRSLSEPLRKVVDSEKAVVMRIA